MTEHLYIACDLGAESGRVILGTLSAGRVTLEEVHRFSTGAVKISGALRWDIPRIMHQLKIGLRKIATRGVVAQSLSVDSWGLDYVLTGTDGTMLVLPYHYRDSRTAEPYAAALESPGRERIFAETGVQFMPINTLYHLLAEQAQNPRLLELTQHFLTIADYLHFLLSGVAVVEESLASTTQLYDPIRHAWSQTLIETFGLPAKIFPRIVPPGTQLGTLLPAIAEQLDLPPLAILATCSHDTAAAVAAVPAAGERWAFLSSGTWSLIGVELPTPLLTEAARLHNFTNEAGFGGTTRFLKNIVGLWLLQEYRRTWALAGREYDYATLTAEAAQAEPFRSLINPNEARFWQPDHMPGKIAAFCRETGQPPPETPGQFTRCIYESLALLYRRTLAEIEEVTGRTITRLHIVGGGSQSVLLNQFAACATGRTVLAGPVEATAVGNVLLQAVTLGHLGSVEALREVVRTSFEIVRYEPEHQREWLQAAARFDALPRA